MGWMLGRVRVGGLRSVDIEQECVLGGRGSGGEGEYMGRREAAVGGYMPPLKKYRKGDGWRTYQPPRTPQSP